MHKKLFRKMLNPHFGQRNPKTSCYCLKRLQQGSYTFVKDSSYGSATAEKLLTY